MEVSLFTWLLLQDSQMLSFIVIHCHLSFQYNLMTIE